MPQTSCACANDYFDPDADEIPCDVFDELAEL
jgi:hypothetical protein